MDWIILLNPVTLKSFKANPIYGISASRSKIAESRMLILESFFRFLIFDRYPILSIRLKMDILLKGFVDKTQVSSLIGEI